jgi:uncharacterized repeat protein (TIGR01451 family)
MHTRGCLLAALASVALLAAPAAASADTTIGTVAAPTGTMAGACPATPAQAFLQLQSGDPSTAYVVPAGSAMALSQWQLNAAGAIAGAQVTLVVVRLDAATSEAFVVGTDTETLNPSTLPAGDVATFALANPIAVEPGDIIGLYIDDATGIPCYWSGGSIPVAQTASGSPLSSPPVTGQYLSATGATGTQKADSLLNLAATLSPLSYDAGLSLSAGPSNAVVGQPALLTATITNHGPSSGPTAFTDAVPSGLTVDSATTSSGSCTTALNTVTCTMTDMSAGQNAKVVIVVTPKSATTYTDAAAVGIATGATDPNSANNDAQTTLQVSAPVASTKCVVVSLKGASQSVAGSVLKALDCKVGKVKKATSKSVPKGDVISTSPGAGAYTAGRSIGLTVSSGKPKPKKKKKK